MVKSNFSTGPDELWEESSALDFAVVGMRSVTSAMISALLFDTAMLCTHM